MQAVPLLCSIAKILQAGLMTRWKQVYWLPEDACSTPGGVGSGFSTTVTVSDMQGGFYILGLGEKIYESNSYLIRTMKLIKDLFRIHSGPNNIHD